MLSDIMLSTSKEREVYVDHDYEPLEKYNQPNDYEDIIQAPSDSSNMEPEKLSLDNAYEPTPCSAHVTMATTCINGNN
jgi:hypothetical protein